MAMNRSFFISSSVGEWVVGELLVPVFVDVVNTLLVLLVEPCFGVATTVFLLCVLMPIEYCGLRYTHELCKLVGTLVAQCELQGVLTTLSIDVVYEHCVTTI